MLKAQDATIEQLLVDVCCWEDMSSAIILMPADDKGSSVYICNYEGREDQVRPTLKEALIAKHLDWLNRSHWDYDEDDYRTLDWSDLLKPKKPFTNMEVLNEHEGFTLTGRFRDQNNVQWYMKWADLTDEGEDIYLYFRASKPLSKTNKLYVRVDDGEYIVKDKSSIPADWIGKWSEEDFK
jgi:hypothetical protein